MASVVTSDEVATALETAADRFESGQYGWIQGNFTDNAGNYCAVGALETVCSENAMEVAVPRLKDTVLRLYPHVRRSVVAVGCPEPTWLHSSYITSWNDMRGRTKDHVVEVLKEAAKDVRNSAHE